MSRILFGTSITNLSAPEAVQLAAAVASLNDPRGGLDPINAVRRTIGLDRLRILPADVTQGIGTQFAAGKYFGRRVYVEVVTDGRGYSATTVEYQITRWLSLLSSHLDDRPRKRQRARVAGLLRDEMKVRLVIVLLVLTVIAVALLLLWRSRSSGEPAAMIANQSIAVAKDAPVSDRSEPQPVDLGVTLALDRLADCARSPALASVLEQMVRVDPETFESRRGGAVRVPGYDSPHRADVRADARDRRERRYPRGGRRS